MNLQRPGIILMLCCFCFVPFSSAATIQLPVTGQVTCYNSSDAVIDCAETGQDGAVQAGVAWPVPRFTDNSIANSLNESVTDNLTGLIWAQNGNLAGDTITWQAALTYIKNLNTNGYLGHHDWRLPNRNELESLVNKQVTDQSAWLNSQGFKNVQKNYYWSSSTDIDSSYYPNNVLAWEVYMWSGYVTRNDKTHYQYFLPVRTGGAGTVSLPVTGQTFCYADSGTERSCTGTGEDGETQTGVAWPSPRFTDNSSATPTDLSMTDNLTGLIWTKSGNPAGVAKTWQEALDYIKTLNTDGYLGHTDWRLPNRNELQSLINLQYESQAGWLQMQGFNNVAEGEYWSSSTGVQTSNNYVLAWDVNMRYGLVFGDTKSHPFRVWPVRSTQVIPMSQLTVTVSSNGAGSGGTVTSNPQGTNPAGISCTSGPCTTTFPATTNVTLTQAANAASVFDGWGGACSGSGACGFSMAADKTVTASFSLAPVAKNQTRTLFYTSLATALSAGEAQEQNEIRLLGIQLDGAVTLNQSLTLKGGWYGTYQTTSGLPTVLNGNLTVQGGDSNLESTDIKGVLAIQGGSLRVNSVTVLP
jgi:hypothetical protein